MMAHVDLAIAAALVCTVYISVPSVSVWSYNFMFSELGPFLFAALAYFVLMQSRQHFSSQVAEAKKASKYFVSDLDEEDSVLDAELPVQGQAESSTAKVPTHDRKEVIELTLPNETETIGSQEQEHQFDADEQVVQMLKFASERNISGTMRKFKLIQSKGSKPTSLMYNIVLSAWINCGNVQAAEDWLEETAEAGMADAASFGILIKAHAKSCAPEKAKALVQEMRHFQVSLTIDTFNDLLNCFAEEGMSDDGLLLLERMCTEGVQPTTFTRGAIVKLMNNSRAHRNFDRVLQVLRKFELNAPAYIPLPCLTGVMSRATETVSNLCLHEVYVTGSLARIKAMRRTLKQYGFMDNRASETFPLNGLWETEHGLTIIIEGKVVRWSRQRASRLCFPKDDRRGCLLSIYGEASHGRMVPPTMPGATKALRFSNGDTWHSNDGLVIGHNAFISQSMSKTLRDVLQDKAYQAEVHAMLKLLSKNRLGLPSVVEDFVISFLGKNEYYVRVKFESKWNPGLRTSAGKPEDDVFDTLSRRHPRVGFRHCWAEPYTRSCGQRALVNGEEVNGDIFDRHMKSVLKM